MSREFSGPRGLALHLLAHEAGEDGDPARIAEAAEMVCQKLERQLAPVLGALAFHDILAQTLRRTAAKFPLLSALSVPEDGSCLKGLPECARGQDPEQVAESLVSLMAGFLGLLISLMGRTLCYQYLRAAWPELELD